jgi:site-specific recombinase XerD
MGRNLKALYRDSASGHWFTRFYADKQYRLSLGTPDEAEAIKRMPVVQRAKMSWNSFQRSLAGLNTLVVNSIDGHKITPGLSVPATTEALSSMVSSVVPTGQARHDADRAFWLFNAFQNGIPTDATAMSSPAFPATYNGLFQAVEAMKSVANIDNWAEIENYFLKTLEQIFKDKSRVKRVSTLFLCFLQSNGIKSWNQINEALMIRFKEYRKSAVIPRGKNLKVRGKPCSNETLNRDLQFLEKAFDGAVKRGFLKINPMLDWTRETHLVPPQKALSIDELKKIINGDKTKNIDGLSGDVRDQAILTFCSNKRRKEITSINIESINFQNHFCHYKEFKNTTRTFIFKAFHLTFAMERFLKRIIGARTSGNLWVEGHHPDYLSHQFEEQARRIAPDKHVTLKNLRQSATRVMEQAEMSDLQIDDCLGHISVSKSLPNYKDRDEEAIYRHLAKRTQPGIEVLSKSIEELLL